MHLALHLALSLSLAAAAPPSTSAQEPPAAPPAVTGVCGTVRDARTGEPLIDAPVALVRGAEAQARTDVDGRFTLPLPPGRYDLRARYDLYEARRVNGLTVVAGACTPVEIALAAQEGAVDEVVVTARADTRREAAVLAERRSAPVVQDTLSAQEISRTPDGAASDAVKRVVSATVVDDKYVYLRGLGGRYSTVLLNGVPLPSPDADEYAVPLDLFPTSLLSSLNVVKTYSPELPGSFAGGTLEIETNAFPARFEASLSLSTSANSASTGKSRRSYGGGSLDFLTFEDGTRALPDLVPRDRPLSSDLDPATRIAATRAFADEWSSRGKTALPGLGLGATVGDTRVVGGRKLGYLASVDYGVKETVRRSSVGAEAQLSATEPLLFKERYEFDQGKLAADLSGLLNVGYELGEDHELSALALYTRSSESTAQRGVGTTFDGNRYESERLQFVQRGMLLGQLRGKHRLRALGDLDVGWQGNLSRVGRDEPDTRDVLYFAEGNAPLAWASRLAGSADRYFSEVRDTTGGGGVDLALPVAGAKLRGGGALQLSDRSFDARRFRFREPPRDGDLLTRPPEELFADRNVDDQFVLSELTTGSDAYDARQRISATYASADVPLGGRLRLVGGARVEWADVELTPGSRFAVTAPPAGVDRSESAVLPSANVIWTLGDGMNLRAAYSYTTVRPQFRELAPFVFVDFDRRRTVEGNPDLATTRVHNADLRWEWFVGESEVLAASAFAKEFERPIETVIQTATGGQVKFENAPGASVYGAELEARVGLRRLAAALRDLRAAVNLALVASEVELGSATRQTSKQRPLQGQSPYVLNASLGWARGRTELTALYNVYGERITEVGIEGLPDAYEQPFHRVDLTLSHGWRTFRAKLALANLLGSDVVIEQGGLEVLRREPGISGALSLEWSP